MAFDTKSPTPKVMFSPAGKVPDSDLQTIANQARSPVAEGAIKMSVYQMDTPSAAHVEVARPKNVREEVSEEDMPEPTKRESTKTLAPDEKNISDVVKKWSKK
jgi:hypothetical protein